MNEVRHMFERALRDELAPDELAAFEAAIAADPELAGEFEAYADAQAGGDLENISAWLRHAGKHAPELPDVYQSQVRALLQGAKRKQRGRLIRLVAAASAVAAAAAVVAVLILPARTPQPQAWPENVPGQVAVMYDDYRLFEAEYAQHRPAPGVILSLEANTLIRPHDKGARLALGTVRVKLEAGASYEILVGDRRVSAEGPAEFEVTATPNRFPDFSPIPLENDPMLDSRLLARFGARGFALGLSVIAGAATLNGAQAPQVYAAPAQQTVQAGPGQPQPPAPPTAQDVFDHLDGNSDNVLDSNEVPAQMMTDFDDDKNGEIDFTEFQAHWKPPLPHDPDDAFKVLDKNNDGKLDNTEVDARMLADFDDDSSGDIDLTEFKAHYKAGPNPDAEFQRLDKNGDGVLDNKEVDQRMINDFDDDKSHDIDLAEFKAHWHPPQGPGPGPQAKPEDVFRHLDLNADGVLDSTEVPQQMITDMDDNKDGEIDLTEFKAHPPKPAKPEDVFNNLDKNGDGVLDNKEVDQRMVNDFDDDKSHDIDLAEFKAHWKPMPPKPEDAFKHLDKNNDGKLDNTEIPQANVNDWDDNKDGSVDLAEFKAHHQPPQGPGPGGPGGPGGGPGGPGGGPGGPGGGPGGPGGGPGGPGGGPGGPGGGPGGPGGPGPKPPKPPKKKGP